MYSLYNTRPITKGNFTFLRKKEPEISIQSQAFRFVEKCCNKAIKILLLAQTKMKPVCKPNFIFNKHRNIGFQSKPKIDAQRLLSNCNWYLNHHTKPFLDG